MRKPNLPRLRARYLDAERAWRAACKARGLSIYVAAAEGATVGRGGAKRADELKRLFDAREAARLAYLGGDDDAALGGAELLAHG